METQSAIELHGTLTIAELTRFQYFHTFRRIWPVLASCMVFAIVLGTLLAFVAMAIPEFRALALEAVPFLIFPVLWTLVLGAIPYRKARKLFAAQRYFREPIAYVFTAETLGSEGAGVSSRIAWNLLKHVRETNSLFLLYHTADAAFLVPKRFFRSPAEMENWRQLVRAGVGPAKMEKPGAIGRWC
jgi:hypothetical protein